MESSATPADTESPSHEVSDQTATQLATAKARLSSCQSEIRRLSLMRCRRAVARHRLGTELKLVVPWLRLRERIPEAFWRAFVVIIGTSILVAIAFLATRNTSGTTAAIGVTTAGAASILTLLVFFPPDSLLDRRRLVLAQVTASVEYEHQNVCSQLDYLRQRRDIVRSQLKLLSTAKRAQSPSNPGDSTSTES